MKGFTGSSNMSWEQNLNDGAGELSWTGGIKYGAKSVDQLET